MSTIWRFGIGTWEPIPGVAALTFSAGEPHVNVNDPSEICGYDTFIDVRGGSFDTLGEALCAADALRRSGAKTVSLACPYLPAARQDRGVPFTAKIVADIINHARFDHVVAVDPHSNVMPALLDRFTAIGCVDVFPAAMVDTAGAPAVIICPDAGAAKRAEAVADRYGLDVIYARKNRNPANGRLDRSATDPLPADVVGVVVDDICDGGATFLGLAGALGHDPAKLRLWTTHGIYARGLDTLRAAFGHIGCADTFPSLATPDLVVPVGDIITARLDTLLNHQTAVRHNGPCTTPNPVRSTL
jgi:ribose-phosphate pyrophosphokinase